MSKLFYSLLFISISSFGFSQTTRETIAETKIGTLSCSHVRATTEKGVTTIYVNLSFQNADYPNTVDIKSVTVPVDELRDFIDDLKSAQKEMGKKANVSWDRKRYNISLYDYSKNLYLYSEKAKVQGYTIITPKQVIELVNWLEGIKS